MIDGGWEDFFLAWFDFQTLSEGSDVRRYRGLTRWRTEWDSMAGLSTMDQGFRIVWTYGQKNGADLVRYLLIEEVLDADNRRRDVALNCHEIENAA